MKLLHRIWIFAFSLACMGCWNHNSTHFVPKDATQHQALLSIFEEIGHAHRDKVVEACEHWMEQDSCSLTPVVLLWSLQETLPSYSECYLNQGDDQFFLGKILADKSDSGQVGSWLNQVVFEKSKEAKMIAAFIHLRVGNPEAYGQLLYDVYTEDSLWVPSIANQLGYFFLSNGDVESARKYFSKYQQHYPNHANAFDSFSDYYLRVNDWPKAIQFSNRALELDPDNFRLKVKRNRLVQQYDDLDKDPTNITGLD